MIWIQQIPVRQAPAACPFCGLSFRELSASGKVGCAKCYEHYSEVLKPFIRKISNGTSHVGSVPASAGPEAAAKYKLQSLEKELRLAIAEQHFERCAELRDEIAQLRGVMSGGTRGETQ